MPTYSFIVPNNLNNGKFVYIPNGDKTKAFLVNASMVQPGNLIEFDDPSPDAQPDAPPPKEEEESDENECLTYKKVAITRPRVAEPSCKERLPFFIPDSYSLLLARAREAAPHARCQPPWPYSRGLADEAARLLAPSSALPWRHSGRT